jgi:hypothetical protein
MRKSQQHRPRAGSCGTLSDAEPKDMPALVTDPRAAEG